MALLQQTPILAVLFVEAVGSTQSPVGPFTPFGPSTLFDQQLAALAAAGFWDVALLSDGIMPSIDESLSQWRERGMHVAAFSDRAAAAECAKDYASLLLLANNVLATPATLVHTAEYQKPTLFVRDAATSDDRHERIDLNDRWTGIAVLPSAYLNQLPELAEDWSLQSALLRHAVQKNVARETMAIGPAAPLQSEIIVDMGDVDRWQSRAMATHFDAETATATPVRRWLSLPLARIVLPHLWTGRAETAQIVTWARYGLLVLSLILALLQWPMAALCLLIPVLFLEEIDRQNAALSPHNVESDFLAKAYWVAWFAVPAIALMSAGAAGGQWDAFLMGGLLSTSVAVSAAARSAARSVNENWVVARDEAVLLPLVATVAGSTLTSSALLTTLAVLVSGFWRPIWSRLKAI